MHIKTIHYCRIHDNCANGSILCCRSCPQHLHRNEACANHPDKCRYSTYVASAEE